MSSFEEKKLNTRSYKHVLDIPCYDRYLRDGVDCIKFYKQPSLFYFLL